VTDFDGSIDESKRKTAAQGGEDLENLLEEIAVFLVFGSGALLYVDVE
jgi:hypothetical protein